MGDNSGNELEAGDCNRSSDRTCGGHEADANANDQSTPTPIDQLCQLLDTHAAPAPQELRAWLDSQSTRSCGILRTWYKH